MSKQIATYKMYIYPVDHVSLLKCISSFPNYTRGVGYNELQRWVQGLHWLLLFIVFRTGAWLREEDMSCFLSAETFIMN